MLTAAGVPPLFLNNPQGCFFKPGEINVPLGLEDKQYFRNIIIAAYYSCIYFFYVQSVCASDFSFPAQHFVWARWEGNRYFFSESLTLVFTLQQSWSIPTVFLVQWIVNQRKRPGVPRCSSLMQTEVKLRHLPPPPGSLFCRSTVFPHRCTREPDDAVWLLWRCPEVESVSWRSFIMAF